MFQQDGSPAHTANVSQNWCKNNFDSFLDKNHWPPNSPDLNPLDYFYWSEVLKNINIGSFSNHEEFKNKI